MATVPETQALIDEINAPTITTRAAVKVVMKPFQVECNKMSQQLSRHRMLLGESEMEEPAESITQQYEHYDDQIRTGDRLLTEIHRKIREASLHFKRMAQSEEELKTLAAAEGYTI
jgi:hypothetical protein